MDRLPVYTSPLERLAHSQRQERRREQPLRSPPFYGGVGPTPVTVAMSPAPTQAYEDFLEDDIGTGLQLVLTDPVRKISVGSR